MLANRRRHEQQQNQGVQPYEQPQSNAHMQSVRGHASLWDVPTDLFYEDDVIANGNVVAHLHVPNLHGILLLERDRLTMEAHNELHRFRAKE